MKVEVKYYSAADVITVDAEGRLDLSKSKEMIKRIVSHSEYDQYFEEVLDLRDVTCDLSTFDFFEIASFMAWPNPKLPTRRRIAIVVSGDKEFDRATFFETSARNRGLLVRSFRHLSAAEEWLESDISLTEKDIT